MSSLPGRQGLRGAVRGIDAFDALDADPTPALAPPPRTPAIAAAASPAAATTTAMCSASGERQPRPLSSGEAPERGEDIFCHPCRSSCAPNPLDALDLADTLDLAAVLDLADALDSSDTSAALAAPDAPSVAETSPRPVAAVNERLNERPSPRPDWLTVCGDISSATFPTLDADALANAANPLAAPDAPDASAPAAATTTPAVSTSTSASAASVHYMPVESALYAPTGADALDLADAFDLADALDSSDTSAALAAPDAPDAPDASAPDAPRDDSCSPPCFRHYDNDAPPRLRGTFARLTLADAWVNCTMMALVPKHSLLQGALRQTGWKPGEGDTRSHGLRAARAAARATGASHD
jgi:hypothetical protein